MGCCLPDLGGLGALGFITPVVSYGPRGILDVYVGWICCSAIVLWLWLRSRLRLLRTAMCILLKGDGGEWRERREKSDGIMDKHCLFWICRLGHRKRRRDGVLNFLGISPKRFQGYFRRVAPATDLSVCPWRSAIPLGIIQGPCYFIFLRYWDRQGARASVGFVRR